MKNGFSTINCRKSCQRPTEIFLFSEYHCTTLTVELELDVSVCAQLKIFTHKNSFAWLNFTKTQYFGPCNLLQIDVQRLKDLLRYKSVPRYHFKLAYVILQMVVKKFLKPTSKNGDVDHFNLWSHF